MSPSHFDRSKLAVVIGGGPAGLMAAEVLIQGGARVALFDAMPSVGRKFLIAGKGGLNLTHSEPCEQFVSRYGSHVEQLKPILEAFGPAELREWFHGLGFETFVGTSGKVFPVVMKAGPILHAWGSRLKAAGVTFHLRHKWIGWSAENSLAFETPQGQKTVRAEVVVLALGGGSWPQTGSDGAWVPRLTQRGVRVSALKPANCGFDVNWSEHFRERFNGQPVKAVALSWTDTQGGRHQQRGEFVVTSTGVEGSLIYQFSAELRDEIEASGSVIIHLDLTPDWPAEKLTAQLSRPRGAKSMATHLKRSAGISGVKAGLLWEFVPKSIFSDPVLLARSIKKLAVPLVAPRPLEESISSAGGVAFEALDEHFMIRKLPGIFCAGEMLDWEAPTGGYLLTACFAGGRWAGTGALRWLAILERPAVQDCPPRLFSKQKRP